MKLTRLFAAAFVALLLCASHADANAAVPGKTELGAFNR